MDTTYRELMDRYAKETLAELDRTGSPDLGEAAMGYSVRAGPRTSGLDGTDPDAMGRRLTKLFGSDADPTETPRNAVHKVWFTDPLVPEQPPGGHVHMARRSPGGQSPQEGAPSRRDLAPARSELHPDGKLRPSVSPTPRRAWSPRASSLPCLCGTCSRNRRCRKRFMVAGKGERYAILHDILRFEPVVGLLYRRATEDIEVEHDGQSYTITAGDMITMSVKDTNVDTEVFDQPREVCPERKLPRGARPEGAAFGDGAHRCPGHFVAIQETGRVLARTIQPRGEAIGRTRAVH